MAELHNAPGHLDLLIARAQELVQRNDREATVAILATETAEHMGYHRLHLAELIALAAVRLAELAKQNDYLQGQLGNAVDDLYEVGLERVAAEFEAEAAQRDSLRGPALPHTCTSPDGDDRCAACDVEFDAAAKRREDV